MVAIIITCEAMSHCGFHLPFSADECASFLSLRQNTWGHEFMKWRAILTHNLGTSLARLVWLHCFALWWNSTVMGRSIRFRSQGISGSRLWVLTTSNSAAVWTTPYHRGFGGWWGHARTKLAIRYVESPCILVAGHSPVTYGESSLVILKCDCFLNYSHCLH